MPGNPQHPRAREPGLARPQPAAGATQLLPPSRVPHASAAWFGILVAALLSVAILVLWRPTSLLLALALLVTAVGAALLAAVVGAARGARRPHLSPR